MKKIIAVFKTHVDIGFTHMADEVISSFSNVMPYSVEKICEQIPDFKWTMPSWVLYKAVHAGNEGAKLASQLIEKGSLCWHSLPFTTHSEFAGTEEFIRGIYFSKILADKFSKKMPISAKMTDVPGHTWGVVSVLAHAGVKMLHLGCNPACTPPDVPLLFYWEGVDGSRVLTFYNKGSYGSDLLPSADWEYPVWLAMRQTNDNMGPPDVKEIEIMRKKTEGYELSFGTLDDFYYEILPFLGDSIPVIRKDLADSWIHGIGTYPNEVSHLRRTRYKLCKIEAENVIGASCADTCELISNAYENGLLFSEHTWGLDVKTYLGYARSYDDDGFLESKKRDSHIKIEQSWDEQRKRAKNSIDPLLTSLTTDPDLKSEVIEVREDFSIYCEGKKFTRDHFGVYQHDVFSNQDITEYIRTYSYRFFDWSVNDLGKIGYPEIEHQTTIFEVNELLPKISVAHSHIDVTYHINKYETPLLESGHIVFPFLLKDDYQIRFDKMASVVDPSTDIIKNANHSLYACEKWVRIYDDEKGILIIPVDTPLFSIGGNMICKFECEYQKRGPTIYFNLFNNQWGTNFPQWIGGEFEFHFRIIPYVGGMTDAESFEAANEVYSDFKMRDYIETDSDIEILAIKEALDKKGIVVRLKSTTCTKQKITVKARFEYAKCLYVNLIEDRLYEFNGIVEFFSAPFEIHSLYFMLGTGGK